MLGLDLWLSGIIAKNYRGIMAALRFNNFKYEYQLVRFLGQNLHALAYAMQWYQ